jgi:predicted dehydrogenase
LHIKKRFLVEAFWPRFLPIQETIQKILKSGIIGKTTMLCAHIGGAIDHQDRITNPSLAGGALLDIGLYPISFALLCFGNNVSDVSGIADISKTGVDIQDNITLRWEDGKMAALSCSCRAHTDKTGTIWGTQGYVIVDNINNPKTVTIYNSNHEIVTTHYAPEQISGYEYEIMAAMQSIKEGKLECEQMPHKETIHVLEIADKLRSSWGVCYPFDN